MAKSLLDKPPVGRWEKAIVELLLLRKHDFETVLKATIMKEWAHIKNCLALFPYFDDWSEVDIQDICLQSKITNFVDGETILGDGHGVPNMSYFIVEGKAIIIQHLILVRENPNDDRSSKWGHALKCMPLGTKIDYPHGECVFMRVAQMSQGACFSFGEDMQDKRVVAEGAVKMMLIPRFSLTSRAQGHLWTRIRDFLDRRFPPQRELFLTMLNGRDWMAFKKDIRKSLSSRPGNLTSIHDVPLSYRASHDIPAVRYSAYTLGRLEHPKKWQWILKRKQKALQNAKIAAAKLEFQFDEEFLKKLSERNRTARKKKESEDVE